MKQLKKENIIINYSESLEELSIKTIELLIEKANEYKILFDAENYEPIVANYFDNLDEFRNFIYDLRGEKDSLPEYARGTYDHWNEFIPNVEKTQGWDKSRTLQENIVNFLVDVAKVPQETMDRFQEIMLED